MKRRNRCTNWNSFIDSAISSISRNKQCNHLNDDSTTALTIITSPLRNAHNISMNNNYSNNTLRSNTIVGTATLQILTKASKMAKRQAAFTLIAYLILWSPYNMLAMMNTLTMPNENDGVFREILNFLNVLIVVNPVINPIIYGLL